MELILFEAMSLCTFFNMLDFTVLKTPNFHRKQLQDRSRSFTAEQDVLSGYIYMMK